MITAADDRNTFSVSKDDLISWTSQPLVAHEWLPKQRVYDQLGKRAFKVWSMLCDRRHKRNGEVWVSVRYIAHILKIHRSSVSRALSRLAKFGLVKSRGLKLHTNKRGQKYYSYTRIVLGANLKNEDHLIKVNYNFNKGVEQYANNRKRPGNGGARVGAGRPRKGETAEQARLRRQGIVNPVSSDILNQENEIKDVESLSNTEIGSLASLNLGNYHNNIQSTESKMADFFNQPRPIYLKKDILTDSFLKKEKKENSGNFSNSFFKSPETEKLETAVSPNPNQVHGSEDEISPADVSKNLTALIDLMNFEVKPNKYIKLENLPPLPVYPSHAIGKFCKTPKYPLIPKFYNEEEAGAFLSKVYLSYMKVRYPALKVFAPTRKPFKKGLPVWLRFCDTAKTLQERDIAPGKWLTWFDAWGRRKISKNGSHVFLGISSKRIISMEKMFNHQWESFAFDKVTIFGERVKNLLNKYNDLYNDYIRCTSVEEAISKVEKHFPGEMYELLVLEAIQEVEEETEKLERAAQNGQWVWR